jgi:hypothetical protein
VEYEIGAQIGARLHDIVLQEGKSRVRTERSNIALVTGLEIIDTRNRVIPVEQSSAQMGANESGATSNDCVQCPVLPRCAVSADQSTVQSAGVTNSRISSGAGEDLSFDD